MILYRSFYEAITELPEANQLEIMKAIFEYGFDGVEPNLSGLSKTIWILIKPNLEANRRKWENGCKPKQKQAASKAEANTKQEESKTEGNVYVDVEVEEDKEEDAKEKPKKKVGFIPPSFEDVLAYFRDNGQSEAQARKAFNHYNNHGWKDSNGKKVVNWKQKIQTNWFKDVENPELNKSLTMSKEEGDAQMFRLLKKGLDKVSSEELAWIHHWQYRGSYTFQEYSDDIRIVSPTHRVTKAQAREMNNRSNHVY